MKSNWEINITGNLGDRINYVAKQVDELGEVFSQTEKQITNAFTQPLDAIKKFGDTAFKIRNGLNAVNDLTSALWGTVEPVVEFDKKARELQSITNVTEPVLNQIKGFAKESAAAFGGIASVATFAVAIFIWRHSVTGSPYCDPLFSGAGACYMAYTYGRGCLLALQVLCVGGRQ